MNDEEELIDREVESFSEATGTMLIGVVIGTRAVTVFFLSWMITFAWVFILVFVAFVLSLAIFLRGF